MSSVMRLSRSANTLYAIVPRWLRWPGGFRAGPARVDGPVVRKGGCAGKLRWQEVARGLGAGGLRWQEWRQGPMPLFGMRQQARTFGDRLCCRFAHSQGYSGVALGDRCGGLALARSPPSLPIPYHRLPGFRQLLDNV